MWKSEWPPKGTGHFLVSLMSSPLVIIDTAYLPSPKSPSYQPLWAPSLLILFLRLHLLVPTLLCSLQTVFLYILVPLKVSSLATFYYHWSNYILPAGTYSIYPCSGYCWPIRCPTPEHPISLSQQDNEPAYENQLAFSRILWPKSRHR